MKFRFCAAMLLAALSIISLTGCTAAAAAQPISAAADPAPTEIITPSAPAHPAPAAAPAAEPASAPTEAPLITKEEAIAIALADAGFTQEQVTRLRTEFDRDDRRPEYEVDFHQGGYEYDYEIHAETGAILSKDIDRED